MTKNRLHKKDFGMIAKSYGYVYSHMSETASGRFAMGTSQAQYFSRRLRTPMEKKK